MSERQPSASTRRDFLVSSLAATAVAASFVPATALGLQNQTAPSDKISLGIIGIGPRCTYDLKSILPFQDVQCVAIADVQASRRDAGKMMVDQHYGNTDCVVYRDFREAADFGALIDELSVEDEPPKAKAKAPKG